MAQSVQDQLVDALASLTGRDTEAAEKVIERDDVIDSLRTALEESCFQQLRKSGSVLEERRIRSALRVAGNLEHVGDAACHIAKHCLMLASEDTSLPLPIDELARIAITGLQESIRSFIDDDILLAEQACMREPELDAIYIQRLHETAELIDSANVSGNAVLHLLAILKYLEKICDFVLNIGETTVYSLTGMRLSYPQFKELEELLPGEASNGSAHRHFWDGISGATVVEVGRSEGQRLVFKEGNSHKIEDEFAKTIEWESIAPARTPRMIGIAHASGRTGILREFAEGTLLLDVLLSDAYVEAKETMMRRVTDVIRDVWTTSITPRPARIDYVGQIRARLRDIFRRHPQLEKIAREELADYGGLYDVLTFLALRESWLAPPFSIWIHGDLNANNIVVDHATSGVVFIDVHRSQYGDYLQDVATLAVSSLRKFPQGKAAKGIRKANDVLFEVADEFAVANGDRFQPVRLRLARARAFITSARLERDPDRAEALFVEGIDLLSKVAKRLKLEKRS